MTTPTPQEKDQAMTSPDEIERGELDALPDRLRNRAEEIRELVDFTVKQDDRALKHNADIMDEGADAIDGLLSRISALEAKLEEGLAAVNKLGEHHFDILTENDKRVIGVVLHQARTALKGDDNE